MVGGVDEHITMPVNFGSFIKPSVSSYYSIDDQNVVILIGLRRSYRLYFFLLYPNLPLIN